MKVFYFAIASIVFCYTSCIHHNDIPFKTISHLKYFNLNGEVSEMQISIYTSNILEEGYASETISNMQQFPFISKPLLFQNIYTQQGNIDVYFKPMHLISTMNIYYMSPKVSTISYSFNKEGFVTDATSFWEDKRLKSIKCEYNEMNQPKEIEFHNHTIALFSMNGEIDFSPNGDIIERSYAYDKSKIVETYKEIEKDSVSVGKRIYQFSDIANNRVLEKITDEESVDSALIFLDEKTNDIYKIEYYESLPNTRNMTMLLSNNRVYKILPNDYRELVFDNLLRILEDKSFKYSYDSHSPLELKSIYIKELDLNLEISCKYDHKGNWIEMKILPDRSEYDYLTMRINKISNEIDYLRKDFEKYKNESYVMRKDYHQILEEMEIDAEKINLLYKEGANLIEDRNELKALLKKVIVKRNIMYYN